MTTPHYFLYPFGQGADDLTAIPDNAAIDGSVSYQDGWTNLYELNLLTNPAALPIPRGQMNQLFFDITNNIQEYQQYGTPQWVLGNTVSYPIYSRVYYNNLVYQSLISSNTNTPGTDATWQVVSVGQVINISSSTTLPSSAYGAQVNCTGSTAYPVTLPTAAAGGFIDFFVNTGSFALVTITPPSGTIQGQSTFVLGFMESCRVYSDGTNFFVVNYAMQPASFLVNINPGGQTIPNAGAILIQFAVKQYDVGNFFDNVTNFRYQPLYPGKYQFYLLNRFDNYTTGQPNIITQSEIKSNGVIFGLGVNNSIAATSPMTTSASSIIELNGSTDYVDFYVSQDASTSQTLHTGVDAYWNYAVGSRISNF